MKARNEETEREEAVQIKAEMHRKYTSKEIRRGKDRYKRVKELASRTYLGV